MAIYHQTSFPTNDEDLVVERHNELVSRLIRDWSKLRYQVDLEVLLLPSSCKLHDFPHFKFTCELCQEAIEQVKEQVEQPSALLLVVASKTKPEDQELEPSDNLAKGSTQEGIGTTIEEEWYNLEPPNDEAEKMGRLSIDHQEPFPLEEHLYTMDDRIYGESFEGNQIVNFGPLEEVLSIDELFLLRAILWRNANAEE